MSSVLYQKYRSQDFDELRGQENITKLLKNSVKSGLLAQAYLFVGSRGTGKTSTARILAKAVNCLHPKKDGNPCNECENCISISEGRFLDLIEIDAASNRGIDQIRELKEKIEFSPTDGKYKVYIIDEVHMLTTEAFNALLKTLEEPPEHVIFILATTDVHKLPPTILSRCQRYDFRLGTDDEIRGLIFDVCKNEDFKIEDDALNVIVQNAKGSYRDALSILDVVYTGQEDNKSVVTLEEVQKILGLPDFDKVVSLLAYLLNGDGSKSLSIIEDLEDSGVNLQQFTSYVLDILRGVLSGKIKGKLDKGYEFAKDMDIKVVHKLIGLFLDAENKIRYANNPALVLEMIIPEMMKPSGNSGIQIVNRDMKKRIASIKPKVKVEEKKEDDDSVKDGGREGGDGNTADEDVKVVEGNEDVVTSVGGDMSVNEIKDKWDTFITDIKPYNGHLYAFLGNANIVSFIDGVMSIEVPFKFHKERIEMPKSRSIISDVFCKVYGKPCGIVCSVNVAIKPKGKADADFVLRNLPIIKKKEESKEDTGEKKSFFKSKKLPVDVEAIFDGV